MAEAITIGITETLAPLELTIEQEGVGGVTGLTGVNAPTVRIRKQNTTDTYLDFADNLFKTGGWTALTKFLTEVGNGHYQSTFDASVLSPLASGEYLVAEFNVNSGSIVGEDHDIYIVTDAVDAAAIAAAVRDINLAASASGSLGEGVLVAKNSRLAYRLDNWVRNPLTGFADTVRLRVFASLADATASTPGNAPGADNEIALANIAGTPDGVFAHLPDAVVSGT